ncbi:MAG: CPBP family intramembrane metalloprotease [bacterium]|nr:MAG: CPBP family intramembrane metalloprotease [bacterium]
MEQRNGNSEDEGQHREGEPENQEREPGTEGPSGPDDSSDSEIPSAPNDQQQPFGPFEEPEPPEFSAAQMEAELFGPPPGLFDRINNYMLLLYAVACLFMYYSIAGFLMLSDQVALALSLPSIITFILPLYVLTKRLSLRFTGEYRLHPPQSFMTILTILIAGSAVLPVDIISSYFERWWPPDEDYIKFLLAIKPKGFWSFIGIAFGTVIAGPVAEEFLFRGFIQRIFQRNMKGSYAVLLGGIVFGASHLDMAVIPGVTLLGILFGYMFFRTGNLIYPILGHSLYNLVSLIRLHLTPASALEAGEVPGASPIWVLAAVLAFMLGIFLLEIRHRDVKP